MKIYRPCKRCKGKGAVNYPRFAKYPTNCGVTCPKCDGTGKSNKIIGIFNDTK